jgi:hypothetical protein
MNRFLFLLAVLSLLPSCKSRQDSQIKHGPTNAINSAVGIDLATFERTFVSWIESQTGQPIDDYAFNDGNPRKLENGKRVSFRNCFIEYFPAQQDEFGSLSRRTLFKQGSNSCSLYFANQDDTNVQMENQFMVISKKTSYRTNSGGLGYNHRRNDLNFTIDALGAPVALSCLRESKYTGLYDIAIFKEWKIEDELECIR